MGRWFFTGGMGIMLGNLSINRTPVRIAESKKLFYVAANKRPDKPIPNETYPVSLPERAACFVGEQAAFY
jgi:hypothetical protein